MGDGKDFVSYQEAKPHQGVTAAIYRTVCVEFSYRLPNNHFTTGLWLSISPRASCNFLLKRSFTHKAPPVQRRKSRRPSQPSGLPAFSKCKPSSPYLNSPKSRSLLHHFGERPCQSVQSSRILFSYFKEFARQCQF